MAVLRIVTNIEADKPAVVAHFYEELLDLDRVMDHGWIVTLAGEGNSRVQLSIGSEGGSGTSMPALSIEVDDIDAVFSRATALGCAIVYPLTTEPWGVKRFFMRDPVGTLVNILSHGTKTDK